MFCVSCGNAFNPNNRFCTQCGAPAAGGIQPAPAYGQPQSQPLTESQLMEGYWDTLHSSDANVTELLQNNMRLVTLYSSDSTGTIFIVDDAVVSEGEGQLHHTQAFQWVLQGQGCMGICQLNEGKFENETLRYQIANTGKEVIMLMTSSDGHQMTAKKMPDDFYISVMGEGDENEAGESSTLDKIETAYDVASLAYKIFNFFR
jgi:hypothetical protein